MKLNLSISDEANKARIYFDKLLTDGAKIDLRRVAKNRSINQNSYIHVLFTLWGNHFGYTVDESKTVVKTELGYTYEKNGTTFLVSTANMNSDELSVMIDKFRNWSSHNGCYLPTSEEYNLRNFEYDQEIERAEQIQKRYGY